MINVTTKEAKTKLSALLADVEERGEIVVICRRHKPVAELRPAGRAPNPLRLHPVLSQVKFNEDPVAPLDAEDWPDAGR